MTSGFTEPLLKVRKSRIALFVALELVGFGATMAITQTIGKDASFFLGVSVVLII